MYAIIETGGLQFRIEPGIRINIPRLDADEGSSVKLDRVLLIADGDDVVVGTPVIDGASVSAQVVEHGRDGKIVVYKRKRRKGYERKKGHRQDYTRIEIDTIEKG